jgi:hypothetical protein
MAVRTYNLADIIMTWGGIPIEGGGDGDKISIAPTGDDWTMQVGTDGEVIRSYQNNLSGRVTLTLIYGAPINAFLSAIARQDRLTGDGVFPLSITDLRGNSLFSAESAWIMKRPEVPLGRDAGSVEWALDCAQITIEPGFLNFS